MNYGIPDVLADARRQLPLAFSVTSQPPWPNDADLRDYKVLHDPTLSRKADQFQSETTESIEDDPATESGPSEVWPSNAKEIEDAISEFGMEALAAYISFHTPLPDGRWGIFFYEGPMRQLSKKIAADATVPFGVASWLAQEIVWPHEVFHYRFDLYALYQELTLSAPLYLPYEEHVYKSVVFTSDCWEEALANRTCVDRATHSRKVPEVLMAYASSLRWASYVSDLCKKSPPGYSDFDADVSCSRGGLGGQLRQANAKAHLAFPQSAWVATRHPTFREDTCPLYVIRLNRGISSFTRIVVKVGGEPWKIHKYDPDPWPTSPHAHHKETGEVLDLTDGTVWKDRSTNTRKVAKKHLMAIRNDLERRWPGVALPALRV